MVLLRQEETKQKMEHQNREMRIMMDEIMPAFGEVIAIGQVDVTAPVHQQPD